MVDKVTNGIKNSLKSSGVNRWHILIVVFAAGVAWGASQFQIINNTDDIKEIKVDYKTELSDMEERIMFTIAESERRMRADIKELRSFLRARKNQ